MEHSSGDPVIQQRVIDLRHLYRSITKMARSDTVDTLLNHIVEDVIEATALERLVVLYFDQQEKNLESRVFYGFEQISDISIPFSKVNGLLKRAYADREPLNVLKSPSKSGEQPPKDAAVKCGIFKDDYPNRQGENRRRHINLCFKDIDAASKNAAISEQGQFRHYSVLTYHNNDQTVESLIGNARSFLIIPIFDNQNFYGYVLADKPTAKSAVSYDDARIASAIVAHSATAIGRAVRHHEMLQRIAKQNRELGHHLEEIEELKSFYESIFQCLRSGLVTADNSLQITQVNKAAINLLGFSEQELIGAPIHTLFSAGEEEIKTIFAGGGQCIDPRTGYLSEFEMIRKNDDPLPTEVCFSTITDKNGKTAGLSCIFLDITQRKKMEAHLARMDRLASLGELASGIAHEIRNPLAGIAGALQILSKQFSQENPSHEIFNEVFRQVVRLDDFVKNLLQFARPNTPKLEALRIEDIIDSALFLVSNQLNKKNISLEVVHGNTQPKIQGDKALLQQVFLNIIINALDAMNAGGSLQIKTMWQESPIQEPIYCAPAPDQLVVEISDSGPGIDDKNLDAIFDPFFTTKSQGTGLGLSITHRIIEQHQGTIFATSRPGHGTTFTLSLPVSTLS
ncbi:MAG: PAS domain-containing protein [Deltaproteobacteria bacterium]|nr:PAS domain-containing protein [Candidatus Anaeroferrophillus wilburensis]MBN2888532.1 PAS domain-containing protein [Deltaproteobacteria bacterium]